MYTEAELKKWVAEQVGVVPERVTEYTRLAEDLGLDGADAQEFMEAFAKRFEVDLETFDFTRHFGPEASFNPIYWLWRQIRPKPRQEPITVKQLFVAASRKRW